MVLNGSAEITITESIKYYYLLQSLDDEVREERERNPTKYHNFTDQGIPINVEEILKRSPGFIPKDSSKSAELCELNNVRDNLEGILLNYANSVSARRERGGREFAPSSKNILKRKCAGKKQSAKIV